MRRVLAALGLVVALSACGHSGPLALPLKEGERAEIGVSYLHELNTHCGIFGTSFDLGRWVANPPLTDEKGVNPPPGWGNPFEEGTMELLSANVAEFRGESGVVAQFRLRAPSDPVPPACEA